MTEHFELRDRDYERIYILEIEDDCVAIEIKGNVAVISKEELKEKKLIIKGA